MIGNGKLSYRGLYYGVRFSLDVSQLCTIMYKKEIVRQKRNTKMRIELIFLD